MENFAYGEINERSFSNPHPRRSKAWGIPEKLGQHRGCWYPGDARNQDIKRWLMAM